MMSVVPGALSTVLRRHIADERQMAFVVGPRQVGKTTVCRQLADDALYLNWDDDDDDRAVIAKGTAAAPHAFQVVLDMEFVATDPFTRNDPCVVPARTLLAQLP